MNGKNTKIKAEARKMSNEKISRREFIGDTVKTTWAATALFSSSKSIFAQNKDSRPNVLFITLDDLGPELSCYGAKQIHTPNIDALAARGTLFRNAFCQQAVCNPSRASFMTGMRPDSTKIIDNNEHFRFVNPQSLTIPQHFKANGYFTQSVGKIYHTGFDDPQSWSVKAWYPEQIRYGKRETLAKLKAKEDELRAAGKEYKEIPIFDEKTEVVKG